MNNFSGNLLTKQLVLFDPSGLPLLLQIANFELIKQDNIISECHFTFRVTLKLYQQIDTNLLFNLKREFRSVLNALEFQSNPDVEIEVSLQPQLLSQFLEHATDSETAIAYLATCSQQDSERQNPLLSTESWFALNVTQSLESGKIGYRTFWSYLDPTVLTPDAIANEQFPEAMEQFLKDRNEADLLMSGKAILEAFEEMANRFRDWDETEFLKQSESTISDIFAEVTKTFENWADSIPSSNASNSAGVGKIYQAIINFFSQDDWAFAKLQGEPTLKLAFKGKNGQWDCYARAIEDRQQFIFYSICPLQVLESQQAAIAELLARLNSGLAIGNFELDFKQEKICFKTSIDVTGDRLTSALIKQLVYTNVLTSDQFLPSIQAVLSGTSPADVLRAIGQPD